MIAARMDSLTEDQEWLDNVTKDDIYCYTFGAIKVLDQNAEEGYENIEDGYENIYNIYNEYDSFGPKGNYKLANASHPYAKFGCTLEYKMDYEKALLSSNNHDMGNNYKIAVKKGFVYDVATEMGKTISQDSD